MIGEFNLTQGKIISLLLMKFQIPTGTSFEMSQKWLEQNKQESIETLYLSLRNGLIQIEDDNLVNLYSIEITELVNKIRGENGLEIKDRVYRFKTYPNCFIGNEFIQFLTNSSEITKYQAIKLGQSLIDNKIIHHVTDEHDFNDDYLFYRFYIDEFYW
jgi:hypothetical protein